MSGNGREAVVMMNNRRECRGTVRMRMRMRKVMLGGMSRESERKTGEKDEMSIMEANVCAKTDTAFK